MCYVFENNDVVYIGLEQDDGWCKMMVDVCWKVKVWESFLKNVNQLLIVGDELNE